jgi:hypothetical protein
LVVFEEGVKRLGRGFVLRESKHTVQGSVDGEHYHAKGPRESEP